MPPTPQDRATTMTSAVVIGVVMVLIVWFVLARYQATHQADGNGEADAGTRATASRPQPELDDGQSPLTGESQSRPRPVLAAKIDNLKTARPAASLAAADLVYVLPVEAGLSRLLAVYSSELPDRIGPIRSARHSDLSLLRQFGRPGLAFSGANSRLLPKISEAPLYDLSDKRFRSAYSRDSDRSIPHNLYADPTRLIEKAPKISTSRDIGLRFGDAPKGGRPAETTTVDYATFSIDADWAGSENAWRLTMDGKKVTDAGGKKVRPANVIVQYTDFQPSEYSDSSGNRTPSTRTTGTGHAVVLRDGKSYDARWSRPSISEGTTFTTAEGKPLPLAKGQSWIVFAKQK